MSLAVFAAADKFDIPFQFAFHSLGNSMIGNLQVFFLPVDITINLTIKSCNCEYKIFMFRYRMTFLSLQNMFQHSEMSSSVMEVLNMLKHTL